MVVSILLILVSYYCIHTGVYIYIIYTHRPLGVAVGHLIPYGSPRATQ